MLIFLHQQKTGGLTIRLLLKRNYSRQFHFASVRNVNERYEKFLSLTDAEKKNLDLIFGFIPYGIHDELPQAADYLTFMRHPVERTISMYYFANRTENSWVRERYDHPISFEEFLDVMPRIDNHMTRAFLYGKPDTLEAFRREPLPDDALEQAIDNIEKHFPIIGLTERFDESLLMIKRRYNWKSIHYHPVNVRPSWQKKEPLTKEIRQKIEEKVTVDLALYEYVCKRFENQVAEHATMALELSAFRITNRLSKLKKQSKIFIRDFNRTSDAES